MKERRRRHDDVHYPLQGRGAKARKPRHTYDKPAAELVPWKPMTEDEIAALCGGEKAAIRLKEKQ